MKKKSSSLKKAVIAVGALFGLLVAAAVIVPLVVDVDKYRPLIVQKADEQLNGKLTLGHLGLSLWGQIKIQIDGFNLADVRGRSVIQVKNASFVLPFLSVLTGHPELRLVLDQPEIEIVKQRDGKMNAMALVKETPASGAPATTAAQSAPSAPGGAPSVPAIVLAARYTVLLQHAHLTYRDEMTSDVYKIADLGFTLKDVSPSSRMPFDLTANLDLVISKTMRVKGPLVFKGAVQAYASASSSANSSGGAFEKADAEASFLLDGLEIFNPGSIDKKSGVPLGFDVKLTATKTGAQISSLVFRLAQVTINGEGSAQTVGNVTDISVKAHSNSIDLAKLSELSPMIKAYNVNGMAEFSAEAHGPTDKINYAASLKFNKIMLTNDALQQPLEVSGSLDVITDQLKSLELILAAKNFDLKINGAVESFTKPHFKFMIASNDLDLDGLLKSSEKAAENRKTQAQAQSAGGSTSGATPAVDYNAMFKPIRENPMLAGAAGTIGFSLKKLKATGVPIDNLKGELSLASLLLALKDLSLDIFGGSIKGGMSFNMKTTKPEVGTNIVIAGLQSRKMLESQVPFARNTMTGTISSNLNLGGAGLNSSDINTGWKGNGVFEVKDATISTLDVGHEIRDGLMAKLPGAISSKVKIPDSVLNQKGQYQAITLKFALEQGVCHLNELSAKAYPGKGLDMNGGGTVKMVDYGLVMNMDLIDTYNLLKLDQQAPDPKYHHFAASAPVGGTAFSPKIDWTSAASKLAQNYATQQMKSQAKSQLQKLIPGGGGGGVPQPQDAVKAFKGLFGH